MILRWSQTNRQTGSDGFTLIEVLIAFGVFTIAISGLIYGYVQANRMAEWSSMSLAAQAYASQGLEQARSAQWNFIAGTGDELPPSTNSPYSTNYSLSDTMDVPETDAPINVTNKTTVSKISDNPPLRQIRCDVYWTFPLDGKLCTNTAITMRAPDQ